ncbi:hypothetical protein HMPREF9686_00295, partial [Klebsiella michiganensis]
AVNLYPGLRRKRLTRATRPQVAVSL